MKLVRGHSNCACTFVRASTYSVVQGSLSRSASSAAASNLYLHMEPAVMQRQEEGERKRGVKECRDTVKKKRRKRKNQHPSRTASSAMEGLVCWDTHISSGTPSLMLFSISKFFRAIDASAVNTEASAEAILRVFCKKRFSSKLIRVDLLSKSFFCDGCDEH